MRRCTSLTVLSMIVFHLLPVLAFGQNVLLNPIADTRILKVFPDQNNGSEGLLSVYNNPDQFGDNQQHSLLKFDLSVIPTGTIIDSAMLTLTKHNDGFVSNGIASYVFRATTDWSEGEATWNRPTNATSWTHLGGDFVGTTGVYNSAPYAKNTDNPAGATVSWNVTSLVSEWKSGTVANDGLLLRADVGNQLHFWSRETNAPPTLAVTYHVVPAPGALLTALIGAVPGASLLLRRRRK